MWRVNESPRDRADGMRAPPHDAPDVCRQIGTHRNLHSTLTPQTIVGAGFSINLFYGRLGVDYDYVLYA